jgi:hypothetical protein
LVLRRGRGIGGFGLIDVVCVGFFLFTSLRDLQRVSQRTNREWNRLGGLWQQHVHVGLSTESVRSSLSPSLTYEHRRNPSISFHASLFLHRSFLSYHLPREVLARGPMTTGSNGGTSKDNKTLNSPHRTLEQTTHQHPTNNILNQYT